MLKLRLPNQSRKVVKFIEKKGKTGKRVSFFEGRGREFQRRIADGKKEFLKEVF